VSQAATPAGVIQGDGPERVDWDVTDRQLVLTNWYSGLDHDV
jgi:hypothetical protein